MSVPSADRPPTVVSPSGIPPVIILETTDPYENLAIEDFLFNAYRSFHAEPYSDTLSGHFPSIDHVSLVDLWAEVGIIPGAPLLLLWCNRDAVVYGRNQNPWIECDVAAARAEDVALVRRLSGGGCVYHDLGNLNYSLFQPGNLADRTGGASLVVNALGLFGVDARVAGGNRAAVFVGDGKVSGSAFRITTAASYSHGTVLMDVDLNRLRRVLRPPPRVIRAKGTSSERAPVLNLTEIDPEIRTDDVIEAMIRVFRGAGSECNLILDTMSGGVCRIDETWLSARPTVRAVVEKRAGELMDTGWIFGKTPEFIHRITVSDVSLSVTVRGGMIRKVFYTGHAGPGGWDGEKGAAVSRALDGVPYRGAAVREHLESILPAVPATLIEKTLNEIP